jgi:serine/threonine protein kinase/tetratricopeptide (TPR) repeat protein
VANCKDRGVSALPADEIKTSDIDGSRTDKGAMLAGTVLDGRFELTTILGSGGSAVVYAGMHKFMDKPIAVKILHESLAGSSKSIARFQREISATKDLEHEGIVRLWGSGLTSDGRPYLVMDRLEGPTLAARLRESKALPWQRACHIFLRITSALACAHRKGIVHRDVKPSNVIFVAADPADDRVQVVDFGLARILEPDQTAGLPASAARGDDSQAAGTQEAKQKVTTTGGSVVGSPPYMSPEQCRSQPMDARSDVYSLGCLMYETICGHPPFEGETAMEIMYKQGHEQPPPLPGNPEIPDSLVGIIFKCLEKDSGDRYPEMSDLQSDLEACLTGKPVATSRRRRSVRPGIPAKARRMAIVVAVVCLFVFAGGIAYSIAGFPGLSLDVAIPLEKLELARVNQSADWCIRHGQAGLACSLYSTSQHLVKLIYQGSDQEDLRTAVADLNLGDAWLKTGDRNLAEQCFRDGFKRIHKDCQRYKTAEDYLRKEAGERFALLENLALRVDGSQTSARDLYDAWFKCGDYLFNQSQFAQAEVRYRKGLSYSHLVGNGNDIEHALRTRNLGDSLVGQGKYDQAARAFEDAHLYALAKLDNHDWSTCDLKRVAGQAQYMAGNHDLGLKNIDGAIQELEGHTGGVVDEKEWAQGDLALDTAKFFEVYGKPQMALRYYRRSADCYAKSKMPAAPSQVKGLNGKIKQMSERLSQH